ncbi:MAG: hypothetical protein GC165_10330 [Armatimonadetes bacterium]|nr:hypothetical protein [Armatimonadota bacterium]
MFLGPTGGPSVDSLQYAAPVMLDGTTTFFPDNVPFMAFNSKGHVARVGTGIDVWLDPTAKNHVAEAFDSSYDGIDYSYIQILNLSDADIAVGTIQPTANSYIHPFGLVYHLDTGHIKVLREPAGATYSSARAANKKGEIIGVASINYSAYHLIYWANEDADPQIYAADTFDAYNANLFHLDESGGVVVGQPGNAFYVKDRTASAQLISGTPDATYSTVSSVSSDGTISGAYGLGPSYPIASFWLPGTTSPVDMRPVVGFPFGIVMGSSTLGYATGSFPNSFGTDSAFIYSGGRAVDLKNVAPNQDGWDFVKGLNVDDDGNLIVLGAKNDKYAFLSLKRVQ